MFSAYLRELESYDPRSQQNPQKLTEKARKSLESALFDLVSKRPPGEIQREAAAEAEYQAARLKRMQEAEAKARMPQIGAITPEHEKWARDYESSDYFQRRVMIRAVRIANGTMSNWEALRESLGDSLMRAFIPGGGFDQAVAVAGTVSPGFPGIPRKSQIASPEMAWEARLDPQVKAAFESGSGFASNRSLPMTPRGPGSYPAPAPVVKASAARTLSEWLPGLSDDALIHLTDATAAQLKPGVFADSYWVRFGDVKHLTVPQYKADVVLPFAPAHATEAKVFTVIEKPDLKLFKTSREHGVALEYQNTKPIVPDKIIEVEPLPAVPPPWAKK